MKTNEKGRIIKALAGFYYIDDGKTIHQCRARGKFRKDDIKPVVGDFVEFQSGSHDDGYLLKILKEKRFEKTTCCQRRSSITGIFKKRTRFFNNTFR